MNRFGPLLERLGRLIAATPTTFRPPASASVLTNVEKRVGGPLVPELVEFLSLTMGLVGGNDVILGLPDFGVDRRGNDERSMRIWFDANIGSLDLEMADGSCRLWWSEAFTPYPDLAARSLLEYVDRLVTLAEKEAAGVEGVPTAYDASRDVKRRAPRDLLAEPCDDATRAFLVRLPRDCWVYDFRRSPTPIGVLLPAEDAPEAERYVRHGEILALLPQNRFAPLVDGIRKLTSEKAEEGDEEVRVRPPATAAQCAVLEARFGAPLPEELAELIEVTTGIEGGGSFPGGDFDLNPDEPTTVTFAPWAGSDAKLWRVHDWGNGDGLYLDVKDGSCTLWWFGHDAYECILVARSLEEYFERLTEVEEGGNAWSPSFTLKPVTPKSALAGETNTDARVFLQALPDDTQVFDLRGKSTPVELDSDWTQREFRRHGELVARALHPGARRPASGDPEATQSLDLALSYAENGMLDKAEEALAFVAWRDPAHPRLAAARESLSVARARAEADGTAKVHEARRRFAQGDTKDAETMPAVVLGVSSVFLHTKHPTLGDISIFRPTLHTPVKAGDHVRLIGVTCSGTQFRASDYALRTSDALPT